MLPVVTPTEMRAIDAEAPDPLELLVGRAGWATARAARRLLGAAAGARVTILAGPGNNGADGRAAAALLARAGARCRIVEAGEAPPWLEPADLVIDAAYGTGFRGRFDAPDVGDAPVLAVDIASGLDGNTGEERGRALTAAATVTFAALKPGLLLGNGPDRCGRVEVVDIGLDVTRARAWLLTPDDLERWPRRPVDAHKWRSACWVVGGSPGMTGAAVLAARGAARGGAGYVRLSVPGADVVTIGGPVEAVHVALPGVGWSHTVLEDSDRVAAFVVGPGLGTAAGSEHEVGRLIDGLPRPMVLDGDGLRAVAGRPEALASRPAPTVLTPHDGEFARLTGAPPGPDRVGAARALAEQAGSVVLLKGPTTVVAHPDGRVLLSVSGDQRLATAGTGDVLAGILGALLAAGAEPWLAAGLAALAHGSAAGLGPPVGLVAGDVADLLPDVLNGPYAFQASAFPVTEGVPVR